LWLLACVVLLLWLLISPHTVDIADVWDDNNQVVFPQSIEQVFWLPLARHNRYHVSQVA